MSADSRARAIRRKYVKAGWVLRIRRGSLHYGVHCPICDRLVTTLSGTPRSEHIHGKGILRAHQAECPEAPDPPQ